MQRGIDRLTRRLNGFCALSKGRHLMSRMFGLGDAEFRLFELYTDAYLWDERYREEYGTVSFPDRVVAKFLGWSPSKVCRIRAKLIEKGLVTEVARGIHAVNPVFEYKSKLANMKQIIADTQKENSPVDQDVASVQQDRTQKGEDSLLSFKGDLVSSPDEDSDIPF